MTKPDLDAFDERPSDGAILLRRGVIGVVGVILLLFMAGMIAGYTSVMIEHGGPRLIDAAVLGAMLLVTALVAWGMWRLWPSSVDEPVAPRVRSARLLVIAALVVSVVLGIVLAEADSGSLAVFSNAPVSPGLASLAIVLWLIAGPVITWLWWQKIDEHEAGAYRDGALVAVHAYMFIAPAWWIASRAGWLPAQDPMLVLLAVSLLWAIIWFVRRYF